MKSTEMDGSFIFAGDILFCFTLFHFLRGRGIPGKLD